MTTTNQLLEQIMSAFSEDELVTLTRELIQIPSHSRVDGRETAVVHYIAEFLDRHGISYQLQPVDGQRSNVIATVAGQGGGKTLVLNGHLDTVPPYEMDFDPFAAEVKDGKIFGRGTVDMKGPVAAMLMTLVAMQRAKIPLAGDLVFTGVLDEEERSEGTEHLIRQGFKADGAIVGEPSRFEYAIGHRGLEWLEIEVIGKTAHGGIPEAGINAIVNAAKLILRIQEKIVPKLAGRFHPAMGPSVMNFGKIAGGTQPSTVADKCIIQIDRRYIPGETVAQVIAEYEAVIAELAAEDPQFKAVLRRMPENMMEYFDHIPLNTPPDSSIVQAVTAAIQEVTGQEPRITNRRGWTDAALLDGMGNIPTVVCGPGDISYSHTRNEQIEISALMQAVRLYSHVALTFCGVR